MQDKIVVRGAREHNLKNIDVVIPRDKLVVITGLSGSGKSSLAFDTIFAEGQRRYVESLSAYARQFLGQLEKPDVDQITGLSPAVSIDQRGASHNPRSTVGTVTEIYDYLRLLFARIGVPHCPKCGREVHQQSAQQIVDNVLALPDGTRIQVLAPLIKDRKGHHQQVFEDVRKAGFVRVRVDGQVRDVDETIELDRYKMHVIEAVVDRLVTRRHESEADHAEFASRLTDSVEQALKLGNGVVVINNVASGEDALYSERYACVYCGTSLPEIEPRTFSFNSPHGACPQCQGLGARLEIDPEQVVPNPDRSISGGAIVANGWNAVQEDEGYYKRLLDAVAAQYGIPLERPWRELTEAQRHVVLYGTGGERVRVSFVNRAGERRLFDTTYEGVVPNLRRRFDETTSDYMRDRIQEMMTFRPCPGCNGKRLKPEALAVTVHGHNIAAITGLAVARALDWVHELRTRGTPRERAIGDQVLKEIRARLQFMVDVGLDYLTLDRTAGSLSGGEAQRIRLATQIGSQLTGVLYVLDEPSIGLHQRDQARLIRTLLGMRDLGNTLLVVEHDEDTMRAADWIVDLGPGAGKHGGELVAEGPIERIMANERSLTGAYLSGRLRIPVPGQRRPGNGKALVVRGARENNLKGIDVTIPLGRFVCVTGVSGSGKSTLIIEVLYKRLAQLLSGARERAGAHDGIDGLEHIDKIINIDQSPIGRTPRSNPATYTNLFGEVRDLFASLPEAKQRGFKPGRFSFNVHGGRCEACQGQGQIQIEMQFLPDIFIPCDVCHGARFNRETLQVRYRGKNIAEVLAMTVEEALEFFENFPATRRKLQTLADVGLGYVQLGQPATTLSGGEAQRVKLSRELSKRATGRTLYVLDEPSVGLHAADVHLLIDVLDKLTDAGNSVLVIEHQPDILKVADWIIDLGPEGGDAGGQLVAEGTPEQVAQVAESHTGQFLRRLLQGAPPKPRKRAKRA
jgi:excinuclease ABC subunit A